VEVSDETVSVAKPKITPKPAVPVAPAPAAAPSAPAAAPAAEESDDQTVKVKRPTVPPRIGPRPMGQPGAKAPALTRPAAPAAPAEAAPQAGGAEEADVKETVKLPQPKRPAGVPFGPRATPAKPAAPFKPATPPKPAPAAPVQEEKPEEKTGDEDDDITLAPSEKKRVQEPAEGVQGADAPAISKARAQKAAAGNTASPLYLVLGLVTLLLMLGATVFSLAQYLDFEQKIQIYDHIPGLPRSK